MRLNILSVRILSALFAALTIYPAQACTQEGPVYSSILSIPPALLNVPRDEWRYPENYSGYFLRIVRQFGRTEISLDPIDVEAYKKRNRDITRRGYLKTFAREDSNFDDKVTDDEIRSFVSKELVKQLHLDQKEFNAHVKALEVPDINNDGVITKEEVIKYADSHNSATEIPEVSRMNTLLSLAPVGSNKVTAEEIEYLSRKAFRTIDADCDGILSAEEYDAVVDSFQKKVNAPPTGQNNHN